jgi:hypothetical protein
MYDLAAAAVDTAKPREVSFVKWKGKMRAWCSLTHFLEISRLLGATLSLLSASFMFGAWTFPARRFPPVTQDGCGTIDSKFGEDQCFHLSFTGEVSAGQAFAREFGKKLAFRLNPGTAHSGWTIEVIPDEQTGSGSAEYVWVVNPPYRSYNVRYLDTSYGTTAKEAVENSPRDFNFVVNEQQFKRASGLVEMAIMSRPQSDRKSQPEIDRESTDAIRELGAIAVAKGRLTILDSRIADATDKGGPGSIEWLKFKVELHVPCGFATIVDSSEVQIDRAKCSDELKLGQK